MTKIVDSYRFIGGITKRMVKSWIQLESPRDIPWTAPSKPLSDCTVALITTGGIALKKDRPFDQEGERKNPWWGDPSYRIIPQTARTQDIRVFHQHIDPNLAQQDMNCLLPLERLSELMEMKKVGRSAPSHYSIMGYILEPGELLKRTVPEIIEHLHGDQVYVVVLIPA